MLKKRSIKLKGHATSITMEDEFWEALGRIATQQNTSIQKLIEGIDAKRLESGANLASAIRVYILKALCSSASHTEA
ncbi:MAG: aryl-sulfate sulfotransferase [Alphaproteobacteria bacterium]|nr:aryl-sulfate sulfotransferase [Alphaproteobacteria bacterium]